MASEFDLNFESMVEGITGNDEEYGWDNVEENIVGEIVDRNGDEDGWEMVKAKKIPKHDSSKVLHTVCERCHGLHKTSECPGGGSWHNIKNCSGRVFKTGGAPRCFVCRRYSSTHDSRNCPKRHPHSYVDPNCCWGCGGGGHLIGQCPEMHTCCGKCRSIGHAMAQCWKAGAGGRMGHRR